MKIIPILIVFAIFLSGCTQAINNAPAGQNNTAIILNASVSAAEISSDLVSALSDVLKINATGTGDALTPLTEEDLNTE